MQSPVIPSTVVPLVPPTHCAATVVVGRPARGPLPTSRAMVGTHVNPIELGEGPEKVDRPDGQTAIFEAFARAYPRVAHEFWSPAVPRRPGASAEGDLPVRVAFLSEPRPHWLLVTMGLTEVVDGSFRRGILSGMHPDPLSGMGFELTWRVACDLAPGSRLSRLLPRWAGGARAPSAPAWAVERIRSLAAYVLDTGRVLGPGHYFNFAEPLCPDHPAGPSVVGFRDDPLLGSTHSRAGRVDFLQAVPLFADELEAALGWSVGGVLGLVEARDQHGIARPDRSSYATDPHFIQACASGAEGEGPSTNCLHLDEIEWRKESGRVHVRLSRDSFARATALARNRLRFGGSLDLVGVRPIVRFRPAAEAGWSLEHPRMVLELSPAALARLCDSPVPPDGRISDVIPGVVFEVEG